MGERKTKLGRGDRYGLLKAAELAAEMIADYERAREGVRELRVESLEEAIWDDIEAVQQAHTDRWQVKRLLKPFDREEAAKIVAAAGSHADPTCLHFGVAKLVPVTKAKKGKKGLEFGLEELQQLCHEARQTGLVPADLEKREKGRPCYDFVASSLSGSADAIVQALRRLWIHELGLEEELFAEIVGHLEDVFVNATEVAKQLHNWFVQHPDGAIRVDVALLYTEVIEPYGKRDPSRPRWIQLARDPVEPRWDVRGPLALDSLIEGAWGSAERVRVQLASAPFRGDRASAALSRLVLHQAPHASTEAKDGPEWQRLAMSLCGGTLGYLGQPNDVSFGPLSTTSAGPPRTQVAEGMLAEKLASMMNDAVWTSYAAAMIKRLHEEDVGDDLRAAMKEVWAAWHATLNPFPTARASFLRSMLATAEEWGRSGFDVAVRTGRLRLDELVRTTIVALAIVSALKPGHVDVEVGASEEVDNLRLGTVPAHLIALAAASHPQERTPARLCDAPGAMFRKERGIAILGVVGESANDLFTLACADSLPFHASDDAAQSYLHPGDPFPILTASPLLRAAMKKGLAATREHLAEALGRMNDERLRGLRRAMEGVPGDG